MELIRIAKSLPSDKNPEPYYFVIGKWDEECKPLWYPVNPKPKTIQDIEDFRHRLIESEKPNPDGSCKMHFAFADRAFHIGIVKDWIEEEIH